MLASQLIKELQAAIEEHGDKEVKDFRSLPISLIKAYDKYGEYPHSSEHDGEAVEFLLM